MHMTALQQPEKDLPRHPTADEVGLLHTSALKLRHSYFGSRPLNGHCNQKRTILHSPWFGAKHRKSVVLRLPLVQITFMRLTPENPFSSQFLKIFPCTFLTI